RYSVGITNPYLVLMVLVSSSVNLILFLFGVIFVRKLMGLEIIAFKSTEIMPIGSLQRLALIGLFGLCVLILVKYVKQLDQIAIIVALTDSITAANQARSNMGNSFAGDYHWYKLVMHDIGNFLTFTSFAIWLTRKSTFSFIAFIAAFSYSTIVAVMAIEKAPFAWLLVGLFMVYFLVKRNGFIPFKKIIILLCIVLFILILFYINFMGSNDIWSALTSVFSRAFSGSISPAYFYLEFFPEHHEYLWGSTFPNPGGLMPYIPYRYTIEVMNWIFPALSESGVVGSAPTVFWGEAYANFGPAGIPIVAFIMGTFVAFVSYLVSKIEINPISIGFSVWLILAFKDLSVTGFSGYFYSIYLIVLSFLLFALLSVRGRFMIRCKIY
ncbi:MAG TPA: O-antigen polymerase, partial [Gracilimonas sp.]|uniref:O-antigen polymerase n=1 Tax=Gracilimonas sp. TaxID=1974203 RepID=UPI002D8536CD|nr:O-antigen polymerase [Gracilimonas sp.]